jgi:hypothetical protein
MRRRFPIISQYVALTSHRCTRYRKWPPREVNLTQQHTEERLQVQSALRLILIISNELLGERPTIISAKTATKSSNNYPGYTGTNSFIGRPPRSCRLEFTLLFPTTMTNSLLHTSGLEKRHLNTKAAPLQVTTGEIKI